MGEVIRLRRNPGHPLNASSVRSGSALGQLKLLLALSRTPHGILDMATPALAALLWCGRIPSLWIVSIGLVTAFAGYTTVYALNDLVDYGADRERFMKGLFSKDSYDLDSVFVRHPMASGVLSRGMALWWTVCWAFLALIGALLLNPVCVVIFLAACLLEAIYCLAWRAAWMKVFVSGVVKTSGAIAAVYAVDPHPGRLFLVLLFCWLFVWEMGGQNMPNDWADMEEDRILRASTVPLRFGPAFSARLMIVFCLLALCLSGMAIAFSRATNPVASVTGAIALGFYLLLLPAWQLYAKKDKVSALALFNRASYYPATVLVVALFGAI